MLFQKRSNLIEAPEQQIYRRRNLLFIGFAIIAFLEFGLPVFEKWASGGSRLDQAYERQKTKRDMSSYDHKIKGLSPQEAQSLRRTSGTKGLLRLSDKQLIRRLEIMDKLLKAASPEARRDFVTGKNMVNMFSFLEKLHADDIEDFAALSLDSMLAELNDSPPKTTVSDDKIKEAYAEILNNSSDARLIRDMGSAETLGGDEAVWMTMTFYALILSADDPLKGTMARILVQDSTNQ